MKHTNDDSVVNNAVLELDFAIDTTGSKHNSHSLRYKQFGNWIQYCYSTPIAQTYGKIVAMV